MNGLFTRIWLSLWIGAASLLSSSCKSGDREAALWEMEREAIKISKEIEVLGYRLSLHEPHQMELASLKAQMHQMKATIKSLQAVSIRLNSEVAALKANHEKLRTDLIRSRRFEIIGTRSCKIVVSDGRVYRNVEITDIGDAGVDFRHEGGSTRLRYNELSELQREQFGIQPTAAKIALMSEEMARKAYDEWINASIARDLSESQVRLPIQNHRIDATSGNHILQRRRISAPRSPLSQPATPFGIKRYTQRETTEYLFSPFGKRRTLPSY